MRLSQVICITNQPILYIYTCTPLIYWGFGFESNVWKLLVLLSRFENWLFPNSSLSLYFHKNNYSNSLKKNINISRLSFLFFIGHIVTEWASESDKMVIVTFPSTMAEWKWIAEQGNILYQIFSFYEKVFCAL